MKKKLLLVTAATFMAFGTIGYTGSHFSYTDGPVVVKAADQTTKTVTINYTDIPSGFTATTGTSGNFNKTVASTNDLTISYSGINTKSGENKPSYTYAMFLKNYGYIYSSSAPSGYFVRSVEVTFGSGTGTSGNVGISLSSEINNERDSSVTGAVAKSGTCSVSNTDSEMLYWNFSTTGANVQVDHITVVYDAVTSGPAKTAFATPDASNWELDSDQKTIYGVFDEGVSSYTVGIFDSAESSTPLDSFVYDSDDVYDIEYDALGTYYVKVKANGDETHYDSEWSALIGSFTNVAPEISISSFRKLPDDETKSKFYSITGVVRNISNANYGNFDLVDVDEYIDNGSLYTTSENYIYVYGCRNGEAGSNQSFAATGVKLGDVITMYAYKTTFNGTLEAIGYFVEQADDPIYNVTYHVGKDESSERVYSGDTISKADPVVDGYSFDGWFSNSSFTSAFDKDSLITSDIDLYAKLTDTTSSSVQDDLNKIESYLGLSYKYTFGSMNEDVVLNVPQTGGSITWGNDTEKDISNGFAGNDLFTITYCKNSSSSGYFGRGTLRLYYGANNNGGSVVITPKNAGVKINSIDVTATNLETNGEITQDGDSYIIKNIGSTVTSGDASRVDISRIIVNCTYSGFSNVDFRIRVATDDMSSVVTKYDGKVTDYGAYVSTSAKSKAYSFIESCETDVNTGYKYIVISLGDVFKNPSRLTEKFTVKAFAVVNGQYLYSTSIKQMSVVDMVKYYNDNGFSAQVEDLVSILTEKGLMA